MTLFLNSQYFIKKEKNIQNKINSKEIYKNDYKLIFFSFLIYRLPLQMKSNLQNPVITSQEYSLRRFDHPFGGLRALMPLSGSHDASRRQLEVHQRFALPVRGHSPLYKNLHTGAGPTNALRCRLGGYAPYTTPSYPLNKATPNRSPLYRLEPKGSLTGGGLKAPYLLAVRSRVIQGNNTKLKWKSLFSDRPLNFLLHFFKRKPSFKIENPISFAILKLKFFKTYTWTRFIFLFYNSLFLDDPFFDLKFYIFTSNKPLKSLFFLNKICFQKKQSDYLFTKLLFFPCVGEATRRGPCVSFPLFKGSPQATRRWRSNPGVSEATRKENLFKLIFSKLNKLFYQEFLYFNNNLKIAVSNFKKLSVNTSIKKYDFPLRWRSNPPLAKQPGVSEATRKGKKNIINLVKFVTINFNPYLYNRVSLVRKQTGLISHLISFKEFEKYCDEIVSLSSLVSVKASELDNYNSGMDYFTSIGMKLLTGSLNEPKSYKKRLVMCDFISIISAVNGSLFSGIKPLRHVLLWEPNQKGYLGNNDLIPFFKSKAKLYSEYRSRINFKKKEKNLKDTILLKSIKYINYKVYVLIEQIYLNKKILNKNIFLFNSEYLNKNNSQFLIYKHHLNMSSFIFLVDKGILNTNYLIKNLIKKNGNQRLTSLIILINLYFRFSRFLFIYTFNFILTL